MNTSTLILSYIYHNPDCTSADIVNNAKCPNVRSVVIAKLTVLVELGLLEVIQKSAVDFRRFRLSQYGDLQLAHLTSK
jgi:hypothetical protein